MRWNLAGLAMIIPGATCALSAYGGSTPCYIEAALDFILKQIKIAAPASHDTLGYKSELSAAVFTIVVESFVRWGCCDGLLVQEVLERNVPTGSRSPRALRLLALVLDYCGVGSWDAQLKFRQEAAAALDMATRAQLERVPCETSWTAVPFDAAATILVEERPRWPMVCHGNDLFHVVGQSLSYFKTEFRDRAVRLQELRGIDLRVLYDDESGTTVIYDVELCRVYLSDKQPDDPISTAFRADLVAAQRHPERIEKPLFLLQSVGELYTNYYHFVTEAVTKVLFFLHHEKSVPEGWVIFVPERQLTTHLMQQLMEVFPTLKSRATMFSNGSVILQAPQIMTVSWTAVPDEDIGAWTHDQVYFPPSKQLADVRAFLLRAARVQPVGLPGILGVSKVLSLLWLHRAMSPNKRARGISRTFQTAICSHLETMDHWRTRTFDGAEMPLDEQVRVFAAADVILGVSGAAVANVVFAPNHAAVILIPTLPELGFFPHIVAAIYNQTGAIGGGLWVLAGAATPYNAPVFVRKEWCIELFAVLDSITRQMVGRFTNAGHAICEEHDQGATPPPCGLRCFPGYKALFADGAPSEEWMRAVQNIKNVVQAQHVMMAVEAST